MRQPQRNVLNGKTIRYMTNKREHGERTGGVRRKGVMLKLGALGIITAIGGTAMAAGDARRGAQLFQQCLACHSVEPQAST